MASASADIEAPIEVTQLPPLVQLLRFLYLNNDKCEYARMMPINLDNIQERLQCVVAMGQARLELPISIITKAYENKHTVRVDETLVALAYCARQEQIEDLRRLAYATALTLLKNQQDFFLFVKYCTDISIKMRGGQRKGWASGLRKCVSRWYAQFTPLQLANMFGEHRGQHTWTHRDFWVLAHIKCDATSAPIDAEAGASTATTPADADRTIVSKFIFTDGQEYLTYLDAATTANGGVLPEGAQRMRELQVFKTNENIDNAIAQIRQHGFKLQQTPVHLLHNAGIWDALLPSLSYRELLDNLFTMKDTGILNEANPFLRKYLAALDNLKNCTETKPQICPIRVYLLKQLYNKNVRYLPTHKAEKYEKKMAKRHINPIVSISRELCMVLDHTLNTAKPVPAKFFITIDLRKSNEKKHVIHNKHVTCFDAMTLLAYSIHKRERDVQLFSFSNECGKLTNLGSSPRMNLEAAKAFMQTKLVDRTSQDLKTPIKYASDSKRKVDVFVVIVDSVARFCRDGRAPIQEFLEYKKKIHSGAKYIVIGLSRSKPDLQYLPSDDPRSFLEICGFDEHVPKLINAFARNCFS